MKDFKNCLAQDFLANLIDLFTSLYAWISDFLETLKGSELNAYDGASVF